MVRTGKGRDGRSVILDFAEVELGPEVRPGTEGFPDFVQAAVTDFARPSRRGQVWVSLESGGINVKQMEIPRAWVKMAGRAVYWSLRKEDSFDEEESLFDFEFGARSGTNQDKRDATIYIVPKRDLAAARRVLQRGQLDLSGIVPAACAFRNLLREWYPDYSSGTPAILLHVCRDHSRVTVYSAGTGVRSRSFRAGLDTLLESVQDARSAADGVALVDRALRAFRSPGEAAAARKGASGQGGDVLALVLPALDRLVRNIERTLEFHSVRVREDEVDTVLVCGPIAKYAGVLGYLSEQLGVGLRPLRPQEFIKEQDDALARVKDWTGLVDAAAASLSVSRPTPNLLLTRRDKQAQDKASRLTNVLCLVFLVLLTCGLVGRILLQRAATVTEREREELTKELAKHGRSLTKEELVALLESSKRKQWVLRRTSREYLVVAIITELVESTPADIHLLNLDLRLPSAVSDPEPSQEKTGLGGVVEGKAMELLFGPGGGRAAASEESEELGPGALALEGVISGSPARFESSLTSYVLRLAGSVLFEKPTVDDTEIDSFEGYSVLRFSLRIKLSTG